MIVAFEKEYLKNLYRTGKGDKKHRFQPDVIRNYQKCIARMIDAPDIEALSLIGSLHYEVLQGDKKGKSSIRVNLQYRIEFTVQKDKNYLKLTLCNILELSNHYK